MPAGSTNIWYPNAVLGSGVQRKNGATVLYANPSSSNRVVTNTTAGATLVGVTHGPMLYPATKDLASTYGASGWAQMNNTAGALYGTQKAQNYIVFSIKPTMYLAGLASTALQTTAGEYMRHSINAITVKYTRGIVQAGWNYVTGKPLTTPTSVKDSFGTDNASNPTRAVPGRLIYVDAGKTITTTGYKPKTD